MDTAAGGRPAGAGTEFTCVSFSPKDVTLTQEALGNRAFKAIVGFE